MIRDPNTGWQEPTITINGFQLSFAEAMAVRVAVSSYRMWLSGQNRKEIGERLADGYDHCLRAVEAHMRGRP